MRSLFVAFVDLQPSCIVVEWGTHWDNLVGSRPQSGSAHLLLVWNWDSVSSLSDLQWGPEPVVGGDDKHIRETSVRSSPSPTAVVTRRVPAHVWLTQPGQHREDGEPWQNASGPPSSNRKGSFKRIAKKFMRPVHATHECRQRSMERRDGQRGRA